MTASRFRGPRLTVLAALAVAAGLALTGAARAGDLDGARGRQAIQAQKALQLVKGLIVEAQKVQSSNPTRARSLLRQASAELAGSDAAGISKRDRSALERQIRSALVAVEQAIRASNAEDGAAAERDLQKRREAEKRRELAAQQKQGGLSGKSQDFIKGVKGGLSSSGKQKQRQEEGFLKVRQEEDRTGSGIVPRPPSKEFLAWREKYRPKGIKLTPKEQEVVKALNTTLTVNFDKMALKEAMEYLHDKTKLDIFVDENSLKDANIEYDDPVTFKAKKVTVRTILKKVLAEKGLTFIIKEAAVQVMTPEKARQFVVMRTYPIADLMPVPPAGLPPDVYQAQLRQGAQEVIDLIMAIAPESWRMPDGSGGPGTIVFNPTTRTITIRQTAEFHYQLGGFLDR
jgi:hypothetical protein